MQGGQSARANLRPESAPTTKRGGPKAPTLHVFKVCPYLRSLAARLEALVALPHIAWQDVQFAAVLGHRAAGDRDAAADALLEIIRRDSEWNDGAARQRFLQLLEAQGLEDPWSGAQRRRLSAILFT